MSQTTLERLSDREFAQQVGLRPDFAPRLTLWQKLLLASVLVLAGATSIFAGLFRFYNTTGGDNLQTSVTECPMTRSQPKPAQ